MIEPRLFHISVRVREMLTRDDDMLCDLYRCAPDNLAEVRARLVIALAMGHDFAPLYGLCDNFDPASGCKGHTAASQPVFVRYE